MYYYAYGVYYSRLPNQLLKTRDGIRHLFGTAWGPSPGNPRSPVGARVLNDKDRFGARAPLRASQEQIATTSACVAASAAAAAAAADPPPSVCLRQWHM